MTDPDAPRAMEGERPADAEALREMFWAGVLPRDAFDAALQELGQKRRWWRHCDLLLLVLGGGLLLAGVIFFIAFNWLAMDKMVKLGGLQVLVVSCAVGAWWRGIDRVEGRALLFAACLLVGVFLAAFGQVYQTGADAWELFRGWALLIACWVIVSRAPVHWLLLLAVTDAAITLYFDQVHFYRWESSLFVWLILAATQFLALAGFEYGSRRGYFRLPQIWPRWLLMPVLLFTLAAPTTILIFSDTYSALEVLLTPLGLAALMVGGYRFYRHVARDLFPLTCIGFCCAWIVTVLVFRGLDVFTHAGCGALVLVGLLVVGMLAFLVRWVRRLSVEMQQEQHG